MKKICAVLIATTVVLSACGSKTDANEKNFHAAMSQYLEKRGGLCLNGQKWPVEFPPMTLQMHERQALSQVTQMLALEAAGMAKSEDVQVDVVGFLGAPSGRKTQLRRYTMTEAAQPFAREMAGGLTAGWTQLYWGQLAMDKVVKWEGSMKLGDYQEVGITYTYKMADVADWARSPEIQAAFADVKQVLEGASKTERKHVLKLTSVGWEAKGLDN